MNNDQLAEFKDFIVQQNGLLRQDIDRRMDSLEVRMSKLETRLDRKIDTMANTLNGKIDDLTTAVADAIDASSSTHGKQIRNHERRILRLEHYAVRD